MMSIKGMTYYNGNNPNEKFAKNWKTSDVDDIMVKRFRDLGAIIYGLTIMVEGGVTPLGWNSHFKGPTSPYSLNRYSGGSSSGSAVAVATGLVPVTIGFDGGGSIRIPCKC
jgi:Asp-tRNA(Asn)/Glu-tRNA(Gln) amidotransferase A subunit family amidase